MGVNDVRCKNFNCLDGVLTCNHNEVCRIEIYAHSAFCVLYECAKCFRALGTGFNGKCYAAAFCVKSADTKCFKHNGVALLVFIIGNDTDMSGDNSGFEILG